jgi:hypothetical protein
MSKRRILAASFAVLALAGGITAVAAEPASANQCVVGPIAPNGAWGGCDSMVFGEHARVWVDCPGYRNFGPYMTQNGQRSFAACRGNDPRLNFGVEDLIDV